MSEKEAEVSRGFSQSPQGSSTMSVQLCHNCFLPDPFNPSFIYHLTFETLSYNLWRRKSTVFWAVTPFTILEVHWCFEDTFYLHIQCRKGRQQEERLTCKKPGRILLHIRWWWQIHETVQSGRGLPMFWKKILHPSSGSRISVIFVYFLLDAYIACSSTLKMDICSSEDIGGILPLYTALQPGRQHPS
jgi:hypothetical protein